jgi:hypothetical protein
MEPHQVLRLSDSAIQNDSHLLSLTISQILTDEKSKILSHRKTNIFEYEEKKTQNLNSLNHDTGM